jgi:hypothetical protein
MERNVVAALSLLIVMLGVASCGGDSARTPTTAPPPTTTPPPPSQTVPTIIAINPTSAVAGSSDLELTLTGANFAGQKHYSSNAVWTADGVQTWLGAHFVSSSELDATVPAKLLANGGTAQVSLVTGDPMGDGPFLNSNAVRFAVLEPTPQPVISSLSPSNATAGGPAFQIVVTGQHFKRPPGIEEGNYIVQFGADSLTTVFVSDTQLTALVPAKDIAAPGAVSVIVETTDFVSNAVTFNVAPLAALEVSPASDSLGPNGTRQFEAILSGRRTPVTWSVGEASVGGTITSNGLYTAPTNSGTFHIVAMSVADATQTAVATVSILNSGFTQTGSMRVARAGHTAILLADGNVLIVGGGNANADFFDPSTGTFSPAGTMTTLRYGAQATLLANGKVLITGGFGPGTSQPPLLSSAELYDPQSRSFTATGSMSVGRIRHTATLLNDGRVLITGGIDSHGGGGAATNSAELYDPSTGSFALGSSMASERADHTATLLDSGKVLIAGGWNGHAADSSDDPPWDPLFAELFDPATGKFEYTGNMSTTRIRHCAIRLVDGKVLVLGGVPSVQNIHSQLPDPQYAEIYDPADGAFASAGNFTISRARYSATLLTNGLVLVAGGAEANVAVTWAELLELPAGALTDTGGLTTERAGHTATRLNDGRVLVTGGTDESGNALASAELYK